MMACGGVGQNVHPDVTEQPGRKGVGPLARRARPCDSAMCQVVTLVTAPQLLRSAAQLGGSKTLVPGHGCCKIIGRGDRREDVAQTR